MWGVLVLLFVISQLPPIDFIDTYITERIGAGGVQVTPEQVQALRAQYGADQPKPIQYLRWVGLILHRDFGLPLEYQRPVTVVICHRLPLPILSSPAPPLPTWPPSRPLS